MGSYSESQNYAAGRSGNELRADTYSREYQAGVRDRENEARFNQALANSGWAHRNNHQPQFTTSATAGEPPGFSRAVIGLACFGWLVYAGYLSLVQWADSDDWGIAIMSFCLIGIGPVAAVQRLCRVEFVENILDTVDLVVKRLFQITLCVGGIWLLAYFFG